MSELSWAATVRLVHERANVCCEYCYTSQRLTGQPMQVDHIDPNGGDSSDNLCLACPNCNLSKSDATAALDPLSNEAVPLFNPRQQAWAEHFEWVEDGLYIRGISAIGRATVERLNMNRERVVTARRIWIKAGTHPPKR